VGALVARLVKWLAFAALLASSANAQTLWPAETPHPASRLVLIPAESFCKDPVTDYPVQDPFSVEPELILFYNGRVIHNYGVVQSGTCVRLPWEAGPFLRLQCNSPSGITRSGRATQAKSGWFCPTISKDFTQ
jgi:hypothetical protein